MNDFSLALIVIIITGTAALSYALLKTRSILRVALKNDLLKEIGSYVSDGAMAFLQREYKSLLPFVAIVAVCLYAGNQGLLRFQSFSFVLGAFCSALAGFIGMRVATAANTRTTQAAEQGLGPALQVSFSGGTVMGQSVVGLALLGISLVLLLCLRVVGGSIADISETILPILSGFSLGASSIALFSRVGGGIYTKAADVGADLVGKVEAGIPEDDPRNPATIADNVGDNVGDVAGMGADLFESFVGSIVGCMILGAAMAGDDVLRIKMVALPMLLAGAGVVASLIGIAFVRVKPGGSPQAALNKGTGVAGLVTLVFSWVILDRLFATTDASSFAGVWPLFFSVLLGIAGGSLIGLLTEFFTGTDKKPVNAIVKSTMTGSATTIISGIAVGMVSTFPTILVIVAAILGSFALAGFYGLALAALGMLLTLGIQLAVDAYGPIADNAGGLAVMCEYDPSVREITDKLDAVGNTTAAIGKGFAIGSAALTSLILFTAFRETTGVDVIDITDVYVLAGVLIGASIPYLFSALAMDAVGRSAFAMVEEVRRQFASDPKIITGESKPNYRSCVDISTRSALKLMLIPGILATVTPVVVGFLGGVQMLAGLLIGTTASGVLLAVFMANAGGAWDNAKKMVEGGAAGGKNSDSHKASIVGDTVGDPFKDTAGPSLNILIKLMAVISLVIAPILKNYWGI